MTISEGHRFALTLQGFRCLNKEEVAAQVLSFFWSIEHSSLISLEENLPGYSYIAANNWTCHLGNLVFIYYVDIPYMRISIGCPNRWEPAAMRACYNVEAI